MVCLLVCLPSVCMAQEIVERFDHNFAQTHDRGWYLRVGAGTRFAHTLLVPAFEGKQDDTVRGWSMGLDVNVGGYIADQLVLHASHWSLLGLSRGVLSQGVGLTYYFDEHSGWFVSSTLGVATVYDQAPDIGLFDQWSLSAQAQFGTSWWISDQASLGVVVHAGGAHADIDGDGVLFAGWQMGVMAIMSWN